MGSHPSHSIPPHWTFLLESTTTTGIKVKSKSKRQTALEEYKPSEISPICIQNGCSQPKHLVDPPEPSKQLPTWQYIASSTRANQPTIDNLLRLFPSSFRYIRHQPLFHPSHRQSIHTTLGAVNQQGRAAKRSTILKQVTLIYRLAIQTHLFYPGYNLETKTFWTNVLADVGEEEPLIERELNATALADIVSVHIQAYAKAHGREEDVDNDNDKGFDKAFELLSPKKRDTDPRERLLSLISAWAQLFRTYKAKMAIRPSTTHTTTTAAADDPSNQTVNNTTTPGAASGMPAQLPNEPDADYIARLQAAIISRTAAEKAAQDTITHMKRAQALADECHRQHHDQLRAIYHRVDARVKDLESELRLERIGAGGEADDPWVPWRDHAGQFDDAQ